jgi:YqaJ-like viral recombinase domain.
MKIYENIQQGTPEWLQIRLGKFTASKCSTIGTEGSGKGRGGLETLCIEKAAEIITGNLPEQFTNEDIERGHVLEDEARGAYTLETGHIVKQVGFVELDEFTGCSPDGLVGRDGLIEIKCKDDKNHLLMLLGKEIDKAYQWQIQMALLVTGRKWCDFVSYNPNYKNKPLKIIRVLPDAEMQAALKAGLAKGIERVKEIIQIANA